MEKLFFQTGNSVSERSNLGPAGEGIPLIASDIALVSPLPRLDPNPSTVFHYSAVPAARWVARPRSSNSADSARRPVVCKGRCPVGDVCNPPPAVLHSCCSRRANPCGGLLVTHILVAVSPLYLCTELCDILQVIHRFHEILLFALYTGQVFIPCSWKATAIYLAPRRRHHAAGDLSVLSAETLVYSAFEVYRWHPLFINHKNCRLPMMDEDWEQRSNLGGGAYAPSTLPVHISLYHPTKLVFRKTVLPYILPIEYHFTEVSS